MKHVPVLCGLIVSILPAVWAYQFDGLARFMIMFFAAFGCGINYFYHEERLRGVSGHTDEHRLFTLSFLVSLLILSIL